MRAAQGGGAGANDDISNVPGGSQDQTGSADEINLPIKRIFVPTPAGDVDNEDEIATKAHTDGHTDGQSDEQPLDQKKCIYDDKVADEPSDSAAVSPAAPPKQLWSEITDDEYEGDSEAVRATLGRRCLQRKTHTPGLNGSLDDLRGTNKCRSGPEPATSGSGSRTYGWGGSGSNDGSGSPSSSLHISRTSSSPMAGGGSFGDGNHRRRGFGSSSSSGGGGGFGNGGSGPRRGQAASGQAASGQASSGQASSGRRNKVQDDLEVWSQAPSEDMRHVGGKDSPGSFASSRSPFLNRSLTATVRIPVAMDRQARIGGLKSISARLRREDTKELPPRDSLGGKRDLKTKKSP